MKQTITFQRVEAACLFLASVFFYIHLDFTIWLLAALILVVDVFMIGYLKNNKVGAFVYNFGHSLIVPSVLLVVGVLIDYRVLIGLGLIWLAHIGMDRALGYGLKYDDSFKHTHLGNLKK